MTRPSANLNLVQLVNQIIDYFVKIRDEHACLKEKKDRELKEKIKMEKNCLRDDVVIVLTSFSERARELVEYGTFSFSSFKKPGEAYLVLYEDGEWRYGHNLLFDPKRPDLFCPVDLNRIKNELLLAIASIKDRPVPIRNEQLLADLEALKAAKISFRRSIELECDQLEKKIKDSKLV